jgi:hypothetical protein
VQGHEKEQKEWSKFCILVRKGHLKKSCQTLTDAGLGAGAKIE